MVKLLKKSSNKIKSTKVELTFFFSVILLNTNCQLFFALKGSKLHPSRIKRISFSKAQQVAFVLNTDQLDIPNFSV